MSASKKKDDYLRESGHMTSTNKVDDNRRFGDSNGLTNLGASYSPSKSY